MLVVRPAGPADLDALIDLAGLSGPGLTSLPKDEATLAARLQLSAASFGGEVARDAAWYTLMLEDSDDGRILGLAAVRAAIGLDRPHFSFRVITLAQYSPTIGTRFNHRALVLVNECAGWTEVGSLFLRPEARAGGAGSLLARSRYMLIGAEPQRFGETVMAELRGWFGEDGTTSPFWEGLACKFYRLPFLEADKMVSSTNGQFIVDLAPRHPIYVDLIDEDARAAIGRCHRDGEVAMAMLRREGFTPSGLIDVFDGGPTVSAPRDAIATIRGGRVFGVMIEDDVERAETALVSTGAIAGFRAIRATVSVRGDRAVLDRAGAAALGVSAGDMVRMSA